VLEVLLPLTCTISNGSVIEFSSSSEFTLLLSGAMRIVMSTFDSSVQTWDVMALTK